METWLPRLPTLTAQGLRAPWPWDGAAPLPPDDSPQRSLPTLASWLVGTESLTARLKAHFPDFRVEPLYQGFCPAFPDESRLLGMRTRERAWIREVLLWAGGRPRIFAHSVVPHASVPGPWRFVSRLGPRPLGEVLFTTPSVRRLPLHFLHLTARHPLSRRLRERRPVVGPSSYYARRSRFSCEGQSLLVTEVFL